MPVPVSVHVKCPDKSVSALRHLVSSLPDPPPGPPPAFTDRDTWIRSLPPARRFKLRLDQSDDLVISHDLPSTKSAYAPLSNGKPWPPPPPSPAKHVTTLAERRKTTIRMPTSHLLNEDWTEDEAFFPRPPCIAVDTNHKRHSNPFPSSSSSPLWNLNSSSASRARHSLPPPPPSAPISHNHSVVQSQVAPAAPSPLNIVNSRNPPSSPVSATVTPIDMALYKHRVADPMSAWVAKYVWKVVTQGLSLPPEFVANDSGYGYVRVFFGCSFANSEYLCAALQPVLMPQNHPFISLRAYVLCCAPRFCSHRPFFLPCGISLVSRSISVYSTLIQSIKASITSFVLSLLERDLQSPVPRRIDSFLRLMHHSDSSFWASC